MTVATIRRLEGKSLLCSIGRHSVVTDRKEEDGGADSGCTSGELLLLAIGSCATGSARTRLEALGVDSAALRVQVRLEPSPAGAPRDVILIELSLPSGLSESEIVSVRERVRCGGVVGRIAAGSEVEIR